jgi:hypothetical protein
MREHDLALLKIKATGLPEVRWSRRQQMPVGNLVGALKFREPPAVGVITLGAHSVPQVPGWLLLGEIKDGKAGVEIAELRGYWEYAAAVRTDGNAIRKGDIIRHIEGHPTPDVRCLEQVTRRDGNSWEVPSVIAGDPIRVGVRRDGKDLELRYPLISTIWDPRGNGSARKSAFSEVFDTDALVAKDGCGGPLLDRSGEVVGIVISVPTPTRVYAIPASIIRKVLDQLRPRR